MASSLMLLLQHQNNHHILHIFAMGIDAIKARGNDAVFALSRGSEVSKDIL